MNEKRKFTFAEKMILVGNMMGAISTVVVFIGSILRKSELPDSPMFNAGSFEGAQSLNNPKSNYQSSNYWSK
jgi:hypothetical protein